MRHWRGLTWDHPRGYQAVEALSARRKAGGMDFIAWERQPLSGFEERPIAELADAYDILVLDHPHLGDALAGDHLVALNDVFEPDTLSAWAAQSIGASYTSYTMNGAQWAVPIDAASMVCASRPDCTAPRTYADALKFEGRLTLSLAGPHAFLTLLSILSALEAYPNTDSPTSLSFGDGFADAWSILQNLHARAVISNRNPIEILEAIADGSVDCCPLVFGYVPYASAGIVQFTEAPLVRDSVRHGSVLGGTGLAITKRAEITDGLRGAIAEIMSPDEQTGLIPREAGQPSASAAWRSETVNAASGNFYAGTFETVSMAWVRPRWPDFVPFQARAAACVREGLHENWSASDVGAAIITGLKTGQEETP